MSAAAPDPTPSYSHIAWMGGSYSPPTTAHFKVAMEMGKFLSGRTSEKIAILIVPVSQAYNKPSVKEACISSEDRLALVSAMVDALNTDGEKPPNVTFVLETHEIDKKDAATATIDSLVAVKAKYGADKTYYIAQGQDNIMAILERRWTKSDELLAMYNFLMYPRSDDGGRLVTKESLVPTMQRALTVESPRGFSAITKSDAQDEIINRIHVLSVEFSDDTSSTKVRDLIANGNAAFESMMTPAVLTKLQEIRSTKGTLYKEGCVATAGGSRRRHRHSRRRKVRSTRRRRNTRGH